MAHRRLGFLLYRVKRQQAEAMEHSRTAVRLEPRNPFAQFDLGAALFEHGDPTNALVHLAEAARLLPNGYDRNYNAVEMHFILAEAKYRLALYPQCIQSTETVLRLAPEHPRANYMMAMAQAWTGKTALTLPFFEKAAKSEPRLAQLSDNALQTKGISRSTSGTRRGIAGPPPGHHRLTTGRAGKDEGSRTTGKAEGDSEGFPGPPGLLTWTSPAYFGQHFAIR